MFCPKSARQKVDDQSVDLFTIVCSPHGNFKSGKMSLVHQRSPSSLRAINNNNFTLTGTQRERATKLIYGQLTHSPWGFFCIYKFPQDTTHTNHPGRA